MRGIGHRFAPLLRFPFRARRALKQSGTPRSSTERGAELIVGGDARKARAGFGRIEPCRLLGYIVASPQARRDIRREVMIPSVRRAGWVLLAAFAIACGPLAPASAQDYPTRPIKIVVPFGPGGPADVFSRQLAQHLSEALKQSVVIENRPGAGSIIGTDAVAKSPPDGYTLLAMSNTHTVNESLVPNKPFQLMRDFVPVAAINYSDLVMVVHPAVAAKDLREFIALAKSKPGALNYASSGTGTPYHMAAELFKAMSGTDLVHVPHKASGEMRNSVIGGHVQMAFDAITTMASNVKAGQVRALGTSASRRSSVLPQVPTIAEAGVPGYESTIWLGIMAPAGTPAAIVDRLNAEINKAIGRPDVKAAWDQQGAVPLTMSPSEFDAYLRKDIEKWAAVVKSAGIKPE
jgi:tripartite-type tricarboxylate transporter receptor subunit TctC